MKLYGRQNCNLKLTQSNSEDSLAYERAIPPSFEEMAQAAIPHISLRRLIQPKSRRSTFRGIPLYLTHSTSHPNTHPLET